MVRITLPDGTQKTFEKEVSGLDIASSISEGLARQAIAYKANNELLDLTTTITEDSQVQNTRVSRHFKTYNSTRFCTSNS